MRNVAGKINVALDYPLYHITMRKVPMALNVDLDIYRFVWEWKP